MNSRRFQFSLKTLLLLLTVVAVTLGLCHQIGVREVIVSFLALVPFTALPLATAIVGAKLGQPMIGGVLGGGISSGITCCLWPELQPSEVQVDEFVLLTIFGLSVGILCGAFVRRRTRKQLDSTLPGGDARMRRRRALMFDILLAALYALALRFREVTDWWTRTDASAHAGRPTRRRW